MAVQREEHWEYWERFGSATPETTIAVVLERIADALDLIAERLPAPNADAMGSSVVAPEPRGVPATGGGSAPAAPATASDR